MTKKRKSIKLAEHERASLIALYTERAIPIDQYDERRVELEELCDALSQQTGRDNETGDILHYMRTQRKNGKWVKLETAHVKREPQVSLSSEETEVLVSIYREHVASISLGTDAISYDSEIADLIAKEFAADAGRVVSGPDLVAKLTALRKRGLLPKVEKHERDEEDFSFDDIDLATG